MITIHRLVCLIFFVFSSAVHSDIVEWRYTGFVTEVENAAATIESILIGRLFTATILFDSNTGVSAVSGDNTFYDGVFETVEIRVGEFTFSGPQAGFSNFNRVRILDGDGYVEDWVASVGGQLVDGLEVNTATFQTFVSPNTINTSNLPVTPVNEEYRFRLEFLDDDPNSTFVGATVRSQGGQMTLVSAPADLIADYNLNGSFSSPFDSPDLVPDGPGVLGPNVYSVTGHGAGLSLSGVLDPSNYSVEMVFQLDGLPDPASCNWAFAICSHKVLDFKGRAEDTGLYVISHDGDQTSGGLQFFPEFTSDEGAFRFGTLHHMVVTRSSFSEQVAIYIDGVLLFSVADPSGVGIFSEASSIAHFLTDDLAFEDDPPIGFIDQIRIYDQPLSPTQVADIFFVDADGDGVQDLVDNCPLTPSGSQVDTDGDDQGDACDDDDDGDGIPDSIEGSTDTDSDGMIDSLDVDSDNDGVLDSVEAGPDPLNPLDSDGDGTPDYLQTDSDLPPVTSATAFIHLDAGKGVTETDGIVTQWRDLSGNAAIFDLNRFSVANGNDPVHVADVGNGQPGINFDGLDVLTSNDDLQLFQSSSDGLTVFTIFRTSDNGSQRFIVTHNLDVSQGFENFELGYDTGNQNGAGNFGLHRGNFEATVAPPDSVQNDELALFSVTVLPGGSPPDNVQIRKNGGARFVSVDNSGWLAAGDYRTDLAPLDIGARFDMSEGQSDAFHMGEIAEVIIYRGTLSDADRILVEDALLEKYRLPRLADGTVVYDESSDGDLASQNPLTQIDLVPGINQIRGSWHNMGTEFDLDDFTFTVPVGYRVSSFEYEFTNVDVLDTVTTSYRLAEIVDQRNNTVEIEVSPLIVIRVPGSSFGDGTLSPVALFNSSVPLGSDRIYRLQNWTGGAGPLGGTVPYTFSIRVEEDPDSDGDGLTDAIELNLATDPLNPDTDGDGLSDGQEVFDIGTDPLDGDTDDDGLSDGDEVNNYGSNPFFTDTDGDGIGDGAEVDAGSDPTSTDTDGDEVDDFIDNCVSIPNTDQANADGDSFGDICDPDFAGPVATIFEDPFEPTESPLWKPFFGEWSASGGVYDTSSGFGGYTYLPLTLTDFAVEIDVNQLQDGGIWLRSAPNVNGELGAFGVLLITGGLGGYGNGLYWHIDDGEGLDPILNMNEPLGLNGADVHIRVEVRGNTFSAFVNGSQIPATVLQLDPAQAAMFASGFVGLYDASITQNFDNLRIETLAAEPLDLGPVYFDDFDGGISVAPGIRDLLDGVMTPESVRGYAGIGNGGNIFGSDFLRNTTGGDAGGGGDIGVPGEPTRLTLTGLPPHSGIDLNFLFAKIASWDGGIPDEGCPHCAPDLFEVSVDGQVVFSESLGFHSPSFQPAPGSVLLVDFVDLGFSDFDSDSAYDMDLVGQLSDILHAADTVEIEWRATGAGWQGGEDESWAIDNVEVALTDRDSDFDTVRDALDNCPTVSNEDQLDVNDDGFGDLCVSPDVVIPPGTDIGDNPMVGSGTTIGNRTSIGDNAEVGDDVIIAKDLEIGDDITVGDNSEIAKDCVIGDGVTIGSNVFIGKGCIIGDGVTIGDGSTINKEVTIGNNAVLGTNVTVGNNATIAANAVIPDGTIVPNGGAFP